MKLADEIERVRASDVKELVKSRLKEFRDVKDRFSELCFCILTANSTAERCISVQKNVGMGFLNLSFEDLVYELKKNGCRFHTKRAGYIVEARRIAGELDEVLKLNGNDAREWLVNNVKGIGMKEASHFLRNVGFKDLAIVDFHIVELLVREGLIERPKKIDEKKYLEIEEVLRGIGDKLGMSLAELDLYLWYIETGKVLK